MHNRMFKKKGCEVVLHEGLYNAIISKILQLLVASCITLSIVKCLFLPPVTSQEADARKND